MKKLHLIGWILALVGITMASCQSETVCYKEIDVAAGVTVRRIITDTLGKKTTLSAWDSITVCGYGSDSTLYNNTKSASVVWLPLRMDTTETDFIVQWFGTQDTLKIHHENEVHFISPACGCAVYHTIKGVNYTGKQVDSCEILNDGVGADKVYNIRLYMHQ